MSTGAGGVVDDDQLRRRQDDFGSEQTGRFSSTSSPFSSPQDTQSTLESAFSQPDTSPEDSATADADDDVDNLPLWLQNFGETAGESSASSDAASASGWGGIQPSRAANSYSAATTDDGQSTTSFLSDDDLPEWLRSLSTPDTPAAPIVLGASEIDSMTTPSVGPVWISDHDVPEATSGGMVFASIVQTIDTRPDSRLTTRVIEPEIGDGGRMGAPMSVGHGQGAQATATVASPTAAQGGTVTMIDPAGDAAPGKQKRGRARQQQGGNRLRLYLAAALIIMLVILAALILQ